MPLNLWIRHEIRKATWTYGDSTGRMRGLAEIQLSHARMPPRRCATKAVPDHVMDCIDIDRHKTLLILCQAGNKEFYMDPASRLLYTVGRAYPTILSHETVHNLVLDTLNDIPPVSLVGRTDVRIIDATDRARHVPGAVFTGARDRLLYFNVAANYSLANYSEADGQLLAPDDFGAITGDVANGTLHGVVAAWKDSGPHAACACANMPCDHLSHCTYVPLGPFLGPSDGAAAMRRNLVMSLRSMP